MYCEIIRWIQVSNIKTTTPREESTAVMPPTEVPLVLPTPSVPGADVAVANYHSAAEPLPGPEEAECGQDGEDDESPQQRREAAKLLIAG